METSYTTKEIAEILKVSDRSVRRYLSDYFSVNNGVYRVSEKMLDILKREYLPNTDMVVQEFTEHEYEEFHKRLSEYPVLKERIQEMLNDLDYHKRSAESHNRQMEIILKGIQQRNFIEAKEKKIEE